MPIHKFFFYLFLLSLPTQLGRHFWPNWSYVWGLRIDYLAPTIHLSDILLGLTLVAWAVSWNWSNWANLANWKKKTKQSISFSISLYFYISIFLLYLFLNFRAASFPQLYLYKLGKLAELVLLGIYVAKTTQNKADFRRIVNLLLIGAVFESGLAIAQFIHQSSLGGLFWWWGERTFSVNTPGIAQIALKNPLTYSQSLWLRPYGTFSHPNSLAGYLLVVLVIALGFKQISKNSNFKIPARNRYAQALAGGQSSNQTQSSKLKKFFSHLVLPTAIILIALALSFSRSVWLAGIILLTAYLLLKVVKTNAAIAGSISTKPGIGIKGRLLTILILLILYTLYSILYTFTLSDPQTLQKRWNLTLVAWAMIKGSPLIGVGLGQFIPNLINYPQKSVVLWLQPVHNIFLLVMAETGLVGLLLFLFLIIKSLKNLLKISKACFLTSSKIGNWKLVIPLLAILLTGAADHYWLTLQQNQLLFALILGLYWTRLKSTS